MVYVIQVCWQQGQDGTAVPFWPCSQAVSKPVWHIPLLCVQWKTPDDGQRNFPKHVEFHSKNEFEKLVHLVGFIIRNDYLLLKFHNFWQNLLYLYSFVHNRHNDGLAGAETCSRDIINHKWLFFIDCAISWIKYYLYCLLHRTWIPLNFRKCLYLHVRRSLWSKKQGFICRPRPSIHLQPSVSD